MVLLKASGSSMVAESENPCEMTWTLEQR
jgi:hypothetical protein